MDVVHIHLILNHVPVLLTIISIPIVTWGYYRSNKSILKLGLLGFIIAGLTIVPVFLTGESAHERVEEIAGISGPYMEEHEEAAEISLWLTALLGVTGIVGLLIEKYRPGVFHVYVAAILMVSLITAGFLSYTGYLGGNIRHTELQNSSISQKANPVQIDPDGDID